MTIPPQLSDAVQNFTVWAIPLILAITLHEAAHGFIALRFGDDTALRAGRVSGNPLHHIDPFGTLLLPALLLLSNSHFLFGWAKPVPVSFGRLKPLRLGVVMVALAGPGANLLLALISAALTHLAAYVPPSAQTWLGSNLLNSVEINLVLAVFNLLPLPPLDGGRVLVAILPRGMAIRLAGVERYTFMILIGALFLLPMVGIDLFQWIVGLPVFFLKVWLFQAVGLI